MSRQNRLEKAIRLYAFVLKFYPRGYKNVFGSQMMQTFKDHYSDVVESETRAGMRFWFDVMSDEVIGTFLALLAGGIAGTLGGYVGSMTKARRYQ